MKKMLIALAALPFMAGAAAAGQPLNDQQMDRVTAGFTALAFSDAHGLAGESGIVTTYTATLSVVAPYARGSFPGGEANSTLYKSLSAAQSSTITDTFDPLPIPGASIPGAPAPTGG
jgi:hypothetical protein